VTSLEGNVPTSGTVTKRNIRHDSKRWNKGEKRKAGEEGVGERGGTPRKREEKRQGKPQKG